MSLKNQKTKSDYIEWDTLISLLLKLERDGEQKFALLIAIGMYTGLRISDILALTWNDVLGKDQIEVIEMKTKKSRKIVIHPSLKEILGRSYAVMTVLNNAAPIFLNRFGTKTMTVQYVNRHLKSIVERYKLPKSLAISTHSLRKSFGRRVVDRNQNSERSLLLLSEILNHSSISTTKIYLGIREEEIGEVYSNL